MSFESGEPVSGLALLAAEAAAVCSGVHDGLVVISASTLFCLSLGVAKTDAECAGTEAAEATEADIEAADALRDGLRLATVVNASLASAAALDALAHDSAAFADDVL